MSQFTHLDEQGRARMVDVGAKPVTRREATARGVVRMLPATLDAILQGRVAKGDVLGIAQVAGVMGAKRTPDLVPLCHPLPLSGVQIRLEPDPDLPGVRIEATVTVTGQTGVEMEALAAVSAAALTVYDMCKALDRGMTIGEIRLVAKSGGRSGTYRAEGED